MGDPLTNNQKGDTMADEQATVSDEPDVQDVSLIDTPIASKTDEPGESADKGTDDAADTTDKPDKDATEADEKPATDAKPEAPASDAEPKKGQPDPERARQAYLERQRTRQFANKLDETYGPKTEEELLAEGLAPNEAAIQALRQEMAYDKQRTHIAELNAGMQSEAVQVVKDFAVFDPESKDHDPDFTRMVEDQYRIAARLQTDDNGLVMNAEVPLYDFYQRMADIYNRGTSKGNQQGQTEAMQMLSRTENPGGSSSTTQGDSLQELEDRIGNVVIT